MGRAAAHVSRARYFVAILLLLCPVSLFPFGPAAHIVILEKVTQRLPLSSYVRGSLELYPKIGATGANGPDINYASFRGLLAPMGIGYAPWADRYHYHLVGSFAAAQIREALVSQDPVKVAWAAGWITHISGDLLGHGTYVNLEAGVALDNPAGMEVHHQLENWAEPYVWIALGGHPSDSYSPNSLPDHLCDVSALPASYLGSVSHQIYAVAAGTDEVSSWYRTYLVGLSTGIGYTYTDYGEALSRLGQFNREARLISAVNQAVQFAVGLITAAERGDLSAFSDSWNLDAAIDGRPIGSLTVTIHTADELYAGTDNDVYFGLQIDGLSKEWLLDKHGYQDFERDDTDDYYLFVAEKDFKPELIGTIYLRTGKDHDDDWKCDTLVLWINGRSKLFVVDKWLKKNERWDSGLLWPGEPTPDELAAMIILLCRSIMQ